MAPPRLDAWRTPEEWETVYEQLYSSDRSLQEQGLRSIKLWSARTDRLPLSIECTGELLQATHETGSRDTVLAAYSLAVIRFVNGQIDKAQSGMFARSVASVAVDIGIPDWMIDIRHDATHKGIPGLEELRRAARQALSWLEERYWRPQSAAVKHARAKVRGLVQRYVRVQQAVLKLELETKKANKTEVTRTVEEMSALSQFEINLVVPLVATSVIDTSYNMALWRPLLVQWGKVKPDNTAYVVYVLCQRFQLNSSNKLFSIFIGKMISEDLFADKCKESFPLYIELLVKGQDGPLCREICSKILNHCSDKISGKYASLRELFNITSSKLSSDANIPDLITGVGKVLEQVEQHKSGPPAKRFRRCGGEGESSPWSCTPLGCLPHDTSPSLNLPGSTLEVQQHVEMALEFVNIVPSKRSTEVMVTDTFLQEKMSIAWTETRLMGLMATVRMLDDSD